MEKEQMFKTALMGGFDKEEVLLYIQQLVNHFDEEQEKKENELAGLRARLEQEQKQADELRERCEKQVLSVKEAEEYKRQYDSISEILLRLKEEKDQILQKAVSEAGELRLAAEAECQKMLEETRRQQEQEIKRYQNELKSLKAETVSVLRQLAGWKKSVDQIFSQGKSLIKLTESLSIQADEIHEETL